MIGVAAELLGVHPQTLRMHESRGLIRPRRTPGGTRLYSDVDIARVRRVSQLVASYGLSLQGAERVVALEDEVRDLRGRVRELELALDEAAAVVERAVEQVHRSYRREVVLWREPGTAVVRHARN
jgi:MerR family transcriptional regulator/heat shock protein HspR